MKREGGGNSLKSWGEVRIAADRQIAGERKRDSLGKCIKCDFLFFLF